MRRATVVLAGLGALCATAAGAVHVGSERRVSRVYRVESAAIAIPSGRTALERGQHLVEVVGQCTTCHGADLGGLELADDLWLGRIWAPNLTPGRGGIAGHSDTDLVRAIRHGVKRDGRPLLMMPAQYLYHLSDADLGATVAWLRQLEPVDREAAERRIGPLSRLAIALGRVPDLIPAELLKDGPRRLEAPAPSASPAYGAYLVETGGCKVCHHEDLAGGRHPLALPEEPPPPDLTPAGPLAQWSEEDFIATLRSGATPDGRVLDDAWMPWRSIARMSDLELRAIFRYLRSLPPTQRRAGTTSPFS